MRALMVSAAGILLAMVVAQADVSDDFKRVKAIAAGRALLLMNVLDNDKDGQLTWEEFQAQKGHTYKEAQLQFELTEEEISGLVDKYDLDKDLRISEDELGTLFGHMDADGDKKVSHNEMKHHIMNLFLNH